MGEQETFRVPFSTAFLPLSFCLPLPRSYESLGTWVGRWFNGQLCMKLLPHPDTGFLGLGRTWTAPCPFSAGLLIPSGEVLLSRCAWSLGNTEVMGHAYPLRTNVVDSCTGSRASCFALYHFSAGWSWSHGFTSLGLSTHLWKWRWW